ASLCAEPPLATPSETPAVDNWQTRHEKADPEEKKVEKSGIPDTLPNTAGKENLFIKIGYGTYGGRLYFFNYNRPDINGIPSEEDWTWSLGCVASTLSVGLDFPDGFSLFASDDRAPDGGTFLVNVEY